MAYGETTYGTILYSEDGSDAVSPLLGETDLSKYLPTFLLDFQEMSIIQQAIASRYDELKQAVSDVDNQMDIGTATWLLEVFETDFGIDSDPSKAHAYRRENLFARQRGAGTVTKALIENTAETFSGADVEVIEYPSESRIEIKFVGVRGTPPNMAGLIEAIDHILPAHIAYSFVYTYSWWGRIAELESWHALMDVAPTWYDVKAY
ncbi:DUF2313 domain-containing protein [Fusibacter paucivorans]|uniref:DUF2313 domain-containing protein n=1 Tax=Fusibacter paucivorans TaxID=76009 RepID=A0ABS5PRP5_9FIRM|nr:putative phage tail protein [Fusibacter paucivorans]MBS7527840.1 DUF2313 domain-containing protein [Fusibacter paucivorans]